MLLLMFFSWIHTLSLARKLRIFIVLLFSHHSSVFLPHILCHHSIVVFLTLTFCWLCETESALFFTHFSPHVVSPWCCDHHFVHIFIEFFTLSYLVIFELIRWQFYFMTYCGGYILMFAFLCLFMFVFVIGTSILVFSWTQNLCVM